MFDSRYCRINILERILTMTTCLGQENTRNMSTKKIVAAIGKWMPIHKGHKKFLINFAKEMNVRK